MRTFNYELLKKLSIDAEVLSLISEIKEHKGKQNLFTSQKQVKLEKLVQIAMIQSTEASNRIEGIVTTEKRLADLFQEKTTPQNRGEEEIMGYRDILNTIHENYEHIPVSVNHILQMHRDLYKFSTSTKGGRLKAVQNYIQEEDACGNKRIRFTPLDAFLTSGAMESICDEYGKALNLYAVEPLLLVPTFILDFLCIHPFADGNGRISRLLTLLLLYQNGFTIGKYVSIEKLIEQQKIDYYNTLEASSQKWHENENDAIPFIKYTLQIILAAYRDFEQRVLTTTEKKLTKAEQIKELFNTRLGRLSKAEIKKLLPNISEPMIEKTLKDLITNSIIKKIGNGKNTAYVKK
jgi:Fic family protein